MARTEMAESSSEIDRGTTKLRKVPHETLYEDGSRHVGSGIAAVPCLDQGVRATLVRSAGQCVVCAATLACRQQLCSDECN